MRARRQRYVRRFHDAASCLWDPVWGGLELHEIDEATPEAYDKRKRKQVMIAYVFALFPSIVVGFSCCFRRCCLSEVKSGVDWSDVRRGWRRYFCSCAFLLAVPQVLFVVAPYFTEYDQTDYKRYDEYGAKNAAKMIYEEVGDATQVTTYKEGTTFSAPRDVGAGSAMLQPSEAEKPEEKVAFTVHELVFAIFALRSLVSFAKDAPLCGAVELGFGPDAPLTVRYNLEDADNGHTQLYLAPTVDE